MTCLNPNLASRLGNACKGNRLEWSGPDKTSLTMCMVHHKNEARWDHLPIEFQLPPSLQQVLMPWITLGHQQLASPNQRLLFVHPNSGLGLNNVNLSQVGCSRMRMAKY